MSDPTALVPSLVVERPVDGVVVLKFNRPRRLNALDEQTVNALHAQLGALASDVSARVIVLTGEGRGFCSGIDVRDFGPSMLDADAPAIDRLRFQERMASIPLAIRSLPQPVVAAVNGPAVGAGLAMALASDLRICAASATFGNAAILLGLSGAEMGMSYFLPRIVGLSVASDWMLTARTVTADEALSKGLVSQVIPDAEFMDRAIEVASQVGAHAPLAAQMTKRALQVNTDAADLFSAIELENRNQVLTHATNEAAAARAKWASK